MSAAPQPSLSDSLSLEGLEPLLDLIFAVPNAVGDFAPDCTTHERTNNLKNTSGHADFYALETGRDDARNQLLTKQLIELNSELQEFRVKQRHLELKLAVTEDQLHYMPELFSKVLTLVGVESENAELKRENAALLDTIERIKPKTNSPSMGRRILNRFFGI